MTSYIYITLICIVAFVLEYYIFSNNKKIDPEYIYWRFILSFLPYIHVLTLLYLLIKFVYISHVVHKERNG